MRPVRVLAPFGAILCYGSERSNLRIMENLKRRGVALHLVTYRKWDRLFLGEIFDRIGFERSEADWGPTPGRNLLNPLNLLRLLSGLWAVSREAFRQLRRFRPTHWYFGNALYFWYACPAVFFSSQPLIYRLGDKVPRGLWGFFFKQVLARRAAHIVCISEFIRNDAAARGIPSKKLSVIHNHPPSAWENHPTASAARYRERPGQVVIGYVGQISADKGVHYFVDAAVHFSRKRPDLIFYLAGEHSYQNPFAAGQVQKVKALGLEKRIVFLGMLKDPYELYRQMDILCVPSDWGEPLGNVVIEAKAAGIPSVIFADGGLPEMVEHRVDGFICREKTSEALAEGIAYFLDHPDRLEAAKAKAAQSLAKFDAEKDTDEWMKIFTETLR